MYGKGRASVFKVVKKSLSKKQDEEIFNGLDKKGINNLLSDYLKTTVVDKHVVPYVNASIYFLVIFKDTLGSNYPLMEKLFEKAVDVHNDNIANTKFPEDGFEWISNHNICDIQAEVYRLCHKIGCELSYKKRNKSAFEASQFLIKNVLSPMDKVVFSNGRLAHIFYTGIDLIFQSFISNFISGYVYRASGGAKFEGSYIDCNKLCKNNVHSDILRKTFTLYNVGGYYSSEDYILNLSNFL